MSQVTVMRDVIKDVLYSLLEDSGLFLQNLKGWGFLQIYIYIYISNTSGPAFSPMCTGID